MADKISRYKDSLLYFCLYTAEIQHFADLIDDRKDFDYRKLVFAASMAEKYKTFLLDDKKELGFTDGLAFLEDNKFLGFEMKDGRFIGDPDKVVPIVRKWVDGFPKVSNHYQYEVSIYVMAMIYGNLNKNLYPDRIFEPIEDVTTASAA